MIRTFLDSVGRYGRWYARAFLPGRHADAGLGARRLLFLFLLPVFLLVQMLHWLCLALDELLFPAYRKTRVTAPVFITGVPRSGTTHLHRALAEDRRFCVFTTWEVLLAPSVLQRRCVRAAAALDRALGSPAQRLLAAGTRRLGQGLDDIHPVALDAPEEDYLLLLPAAACFLLLLAFPHDPWLSRLPTPGQLPDRQRERLLDFYHGLLQRHLHAASGPGRLLSKNAAFAGWPPYLLERYPDAVVLVCVREPEAALASQLKALAPARAAFGTDACGDATRSQFAMLYRDFYLEIDAFVCSAAARAVRVVIQEEMRDNTPAVLAVLREFVQARPGGPGPPAGTPAAYSPPPLSTAVAQGAGEWLIDASAAYRRLRESPLKVRVAA